MIHNYYNSADSLQNKIIFIHISIIDWLLERKDGFDVICNNVC